MATRTIPETLRVLRTAVEASRPMSREEAFGSAFFRTKLTLWRERRALALTALAARRGARA